MEVSRKMLPAFPFEVISCMKLWTLTGTSDSAGARVPQGLDLRDDCRTSH